MPQEAVTLIPDGGSSPETTPPKFLRYYASIAPGLDTPLPASAEPLAKAVLDFEKSENCQAWLVLQSDYDTKHPLDELRYQTATVVLNASKDFESGEKKKMAIFLHTYGGDAEAAYRIATFLQKKLGSFELVVPRMAKSAGTLLALGASKIIMGQSEGRRRRLDMGCARS